MTLGILNSHEIKSDFDSKMLGSVVRKLDSEFFQLPQKGIKGSDTKNIDLTRDRKSLQLENDEL